MCSVRFRESRKNIRCPGLPVYFWEASLVLLHLPHGRIDSLCLRLNQHLLERGHLHWQNKKTKPKNLK